MNLRLFLTCFLTVQFAFICKAQIQLDSTVVTLEVLVTDLEVPWDMSLASDGWVWVTELDGTISRLNPSTNDWQEIYMVPDVEVFGFSAGMHSIVLHPDFENNPYVYVHYLFSQSSSRIERYTFDTVNSTMIAPMVLLDNIPGGASHNGSRMIILDDLLYVTIGDGFADPNEAQNTSSLNGNVLRMTLDGGIPQDNPVVGSLIYSWGHRNPQGLCIGNGTIYSSEHGTSIDDEINIIESDRNYGWPEVEGYCDLPSETAFCNSENVKEPIWIWTSAIAPCGMDYYNHPSIPEWQNSLMLAVLKDKQMRQLKLNMSGESVLEDNAFLTNEFGRIRDVLVLTDGRILICTSNNDFIGTPSAMDDRIIALQGDGATDLEENALFSISISPNPSNGVIRLNDGLSNSNPGPYQVSVMDLLGRTVHESIIPNLKQTINLEKSNIKQGTYLLLIQNQKLNYSAKIILE